MSPAAHRAALKVGFCAVAFIWAFVAVEQRWGVVTVFFLASVAVAFGASAALDMARLAYEDEDDRAEW